MEGYTRAQIYLTGDTDVTEFVTVVNTKSPTDKYVIENEDGSFKANARSIMGVLYATRDFQDNMFLVNLTNDGVFPSGIDRFRANYNPNITH